MSKDGKHIQDLAPPDQLELFDTEAFRVEAVLSRLPIHILSHENPELINIQMPGLSWEVKPGHLGMPGRLAYKLDSIFVNHRIDENRPGLTKVIKLGSIREILKELGMAVNGTNGAAVKKALLQNATAFIQAKVPYRNKDFEGSFEFGDTRYGVIFQNQALPDGTKADAIYIVLHDLYLQFLRAAPVRPIRSTYLKHLSGSSFAQRLYEILSFQFYGAFVQGKPYAFLRYSEYCQQAPLPRKSEKGAIQRQMWDIHKPHIKAKYIRSVEYEVIEDSDLPDFNIKYYPGLLARQEYDLFRRNSLLDARPCGYRLSTSIALSGRRQMPESLGPPQELVAFFQGLRYGESQKGFAKSEERFASGLIERWGVGAAKEMVMAAYRKAEGAGSKPIYLTGLRRYIEEVESERDVQRPRVTQGKGARRS